MFRNASRKSVDCKKESKGIHSTLSVTVLRMELGQGRDFFCTQRGRVRLSTELMR